MNKMYEAYDKLLIELGCCAHDRQQKKRREKSKASKKIILSTEENEHKIYVMCERK